MMSRKYGIMAACLAMVSTFTAWCGESAYEFTVNDDGKFTQNGISFWERAEGREGKYSVVVHDGVNGLATTGLYYIKVDDNLAEKLIPSKERNDKDIAIELKYFDGAKGSFIIRYDSSDVTWKAIAGHPGAWRTATPEKIALKGDMQWKTIELPLPYADFRSNRLNDADIRIDLNGEAQKGFAVSSLKLKAVPNVEKDIKTLNQKLRISGSQGLSEYGFGARHKGSFVQQNSQPLVMEAEHAGEITCTENNPVGRDEKASGQAYIHFIESAKWDFELKEAGKYRVWLRSSFPHQGGWNHTEDIDGRGEYVDDGNLGPKNGWCWIKGIAAELAAGKHTLNMNYMGGARLDMVVLMPEKAGMPDLNKLNVGQAGKITAEIVTAPVKPFDVAKWLKAEFEILNAPEQTVEYSVDGGKKWMPLPTDGNLSAIACQGAGADSIQFKIKVTGDEKNVPLFFGAALTYLPGSKNFKIIENAAMKIEFDSVRVRKIFDKKRNLEVAASSPVSETMANITVKKPGNSPTQTLDLLSAAFEGFRIEGSQAEPVAVFEYLMPNGIRLFPKVKLLENGQSEWTMEIITPAGVEVCEISYPVLCGISLGGDPSDDLTFCAETWRQVWKNAYKRKGGKTSYGTSVRWMSMWDAKQGVYLGVEDPRFDDWFFYRSSDGNGAAMMGAAQRILAKPASTWKSGIYRFALVDGNSWIPAADISRSYNQKTLKKPDVHPYIKWLVDGWDYPNSNNYPWDGWDVINSMDADKRSGKSFKNKNYYAEIPLVAANRQMLDGADAAYCGLYPYPGLVWGSVREFTEKLALNRALGGFYTPYLNYNLWAPGYGHYKRIGSFPKSRLPKDAPLPDDEWYAKVATYRYDGSYSRVETDPFGEYPMAVCSPEWRKWLRYWTDRYLKWGADGMYYDQLNMTYYNGKLYPDYADSYGSWIKASVDNLRIIKDESRKINPYSTSSGEVCNEVIGQVLDLHMTSAVFSHHQIYKYCNPDHLIIDGKWNGGNTALMHRFIWQSGARFEQGIYPEYLALRKAVKSILYDSSYMDTKGIVITAQDGKIVDESLPIPKETDLVYPAPAGLNARWFLYKNGGETGAVINIINVAGEEKKGKDVIVTPHKGAKLTVSTEQFGAVKFAMAFPLGGKPFALKGTQKGNEYTFEIPEVEASSIILSNSMRPLIEWSQDPVTTGGKKVRQHVKITNVNAESMQGSVSMRLPKGWKAPGEIKFGPVASGSETELDLEYDIPAGAALGRHDTWTDIRSSSGDFSAYHYVVVNEPVLMDFRGKHGQFRVWLRNLSNQDFSGTLTLSGNDGLKCSAEKEFTLKANDALEIPVKVDDVPKLREVSEIQAKVTVGKMTIERVKSVMPLIPNGDFETDSASDGKPDWWMCRTDSGDWAYQKLSLSKDAHSGKYSLRLDPPDKNQKRSYVYPLNYGAEIGKTYRITFYAKTEAQSGISLMFAGNIINIKGDIDAEPSLPGETASVSDSEKKNQAKWKKYSAEFKIGEVRWNYFQIQNSSSYPLLIDDITIEEIQK